MGSPLFFPAACPIYFWTIVLSQIMVLIATAVDKARRTMYMISRFVMNRTSKNGQKTRRPLM